MKLTLEQVLEKYQSNIYKAAFYICKHHDDAEDIAQEAFLAYFKEDQDFESEEHIKAWLLRVTVNKAKNLKTSFWHRKKVSVPDFTEWFASRNEESEEGISETSENLIRAVMGLPEKCRVVVHLFYYEGYSVKEIAKIVEKKENTVKAHLYRGREILREKLKEEW